MIINSEIKLTRVDIIRIIEDHFRKSWFVKQGSEIKFESIEFKEIIDEEECISYLFPDETMYFIFTIRNIK